MCAGSRQPSWVPISAICQVSPLRGYACLFVVYKTMAIYTLPQPSVCTLQLLSPSIHRGRTMAGLQRSSQTFRRSGSSGLVWDERLMSEDGHQMDQGASVDPEDGAMEFKELRYSRSVGSIGLQRMDNDGVEHRRCKNGNQGFHTRSVAPALDPPSPKVPGCIFCGIFRKAGASEPSKPRRYR